MLTERLEYPGASVNDNQSFSTGRKRTPRLAVSSPLTRLASLATLSREGRGWNSPHLACRVTK